MSTFKTWSILSVGLLAAACATAGKPDARHGGDAGQPLPESTEPNAFPGEASAPSEPDADFAKDESAPAEEAEAAPAPSSPRSSSPAPASRAPSSYGYGDGYGASADKSEGRAEASRGAPTKKSAPTYEPAPERPGLGTTWGETMASRVSDAPFERATRSPFSLATINYNDQTGIAAMLGGPSRDNAGLAAFRTDAAARIGNGLISVRLVDASGAPLPTFASGGRNLAEGEIGQRYMIELVNQSASRFEAVVTVDGLDVIDGRPGALSKRGYLLAPFATVDIDGFRRSMDEVAAFRFGSVRGSYAAQKGNDRNVGVIGVAFFAERGTAPVWTERELNRRETADPFPGRFAAPPLAR